ncbi:hypothetical protein [Nostoc sp.]|uniref:hypothetical protein n=1 Tax=Nostoc sp. TaxID=1180 RepID=UPI002FFD1EF9
MTSAWLVIITHFVTKLHIFLLDFLKAFRIYLRKGKVLLSLRSRRVSLHKCCYGNEAGLVPKNWGKEYI